MLEYLWRTYSDPKERLEDYHNGFYDIVFSKTLTLCGLSWNSYREKNIDLFYNRYEDMLMDSLVKFMESKSKHDDSKGTFYSYLINFFPYIFSSIYKKYQKYYDYIDIDSLALEEESSTYDTINKLGVYILSTGYYGERSEAS